MRILRRPHLVFLLAVLLLAPACEQQEENEDVTQEIEIEAYDFYFEEETLLFGLGAEVTVDLINVGDATHSFVVPDLDVEAEAASGETIEMTFSVPDEPGVFDFFCKYHPDEMNGTLSVGGGDIEQEEEIDEEEEFDEENDDVDVEVET